MAGDEAEALLGELERVRSYLAWKCGGLNAVQLNTRLEPSAITLGGLLKHLALVEDSHFSRLLLAQPAGAPWDAVDWDADPDWEWRTAADDTPEQLMTLWEQAVERSRRVVNAALEQGGLDQLGRYVGRNDQSPNLRRILLDLVEEYARHVGHADLIRESIDGLTGEDPDD
jgi:Protein of unknown function (DUF664)